MCAHAKQEAELQGMQKALQALAGEPFEDTTPATTQARCRTRIPPPAAAAVTGGMAGSRRPQPVAPGPLQQHQHQQQPPARHGMPQSAPGQAASRQQWPQGSWPHPYAQKAAQASHKTAAPQRAVRGEDTVLHAAPFWPHAAPAAPQTRSPAPHPSRQPHAPPQAALPTGLQPCSPTADARGGQDAAGGWQRAAQAASPKPYTVTEPNSPSASQQLPAAPWQPPPRVQPVPSACLLTETTMTRCFCRCLCVHLLGASAAASCAHVSQGLDGTVMAGRHRQRIGPPLKHGHACRTVPPVQQQRSGRRDCWVVRELHHFARDGPPPEQRYLYAGEAWLPDLCSFPGLPPACAGWGRCTCRGR